MARWPSRILRDRPRPMRQTIWSYSPTSSARPGSSPACPIRIGCCASRQASRSAKTRYSFFVSCPGVGVAMVVAGKSTHGGAKQPYEFASSRFAAASHLRLISSTSDSVRGSIPMKRFCAFDTLISSSSFVCSGEIAKTSASYKPHAGHRQNGTIPQAASMHPITVMRIMSLFMPPR
jgi:hypothetical protein